MIDQNTYLYYVAIDDKPQILADIKASIGDRVTTVFVKQGKYAASQMPPNFHPDISVLHIADLRNFSADQFMKGHK